MLLFTAWMRKQARLKGQDAQASSTNGRGNGSPEE